MCYIYNILFGYRAAPFPRGALPCSPTHASGRPAQASTVAQKASLAYRHRHNHKPSKCEPMRQDAGSGPAFRTRLAGALGIAPRNTIWGGAAPCRTRKRKRMHCKCQKWRKADYRADTGMPPCRRRCERRDIAWRLCHPFGKEWFWALAARYHRGACPVERICHAV